MNETELKELEEKYVLIKRSRFWAFCGGVAFAVVACGFISYNGAIAAVERLGGRQAIQRIKAHETEAAVLHNNIARMAEESRRNASAITELIDARIEAHELEKSRLQRIAALNAEKVKLEQDIKLAEVTPGIPAVIRRDRLIASARVRIQQIDAEIKSLNEPK